ncbi:MAG: right-handed parallel beta-helix repeat-containing protein [Planctomycetota bacterium]|nr:right-handed parallel beta-helix repeat-containing protein [Planctomycetota bacterium]MDA0932225.1 right-handed parallel beta-helix repeat-containing protein [Planctomycetota bacterium]MDA1220943.1 right-handed parallel beta-helix repeat-containing protein [Planctomycetota bacterium]
MRHQNRLPIRTADDALSSLRRLGVPLLAVLGACSVGVPEPAGNSLGGSSPPAADAGPDRAVVAGDLVFLDAGRSSDPDGDELATSWQILEAPPGAAPSLVGHDQSACQLRTDSPGRYRIELTVDDGTHAVTDEVVVDASEGHALRVGPGRPYLVPSEAALAARDGDEIRIDPGVYRGDVAVFHAHDLRIVAAGGPVVLDAEGRAAQGKAIWVLNGDRTTIEGLTFTGCRVNDGNGAGIRHQGGALVLRACRFVRNQMGFLCGDLATTDLLFEGCEFGWSESDTALAHGLYVNRVRSLELRHCYVHHARRGHLVKSRARTTRILGCWVGDEEDGASSYCIDLPDGGEAYLLGNVLQKGPNSQNQILVSFGEENAGIHPLDEVWLAHNTMVIDRTSGAFVRAAAGTAHLRNNLRSGPGRELIGSGDTAGDVWAQAQTFVDAPTFDYRPRAESPAIDAGVDPGSVRGVGLLPQIEYAPTASHRIRQLSGTPDVGAFEFLDP